MRNIDSDRETLTIKGLEQSGRYSQQLLEQLKSGNFEDELARVSENDRKERKFMEPLLYAVKKDKGTYVVFKHYSDSLKRDIIRDNRELAVDIVINEPELIVGTPISRNPQFILDYVESNPKIIRYVDSRLITNENFINYLNNKNNLEITSEIARAGLVAEILSNSQLSNDKDFMSKAIRNDATFLEYASEELRNDGEFLRNEASKNEDVINYVIDNTEKFGLEGIEGVRESSSDYITLNQEYSEIVDKKAEKEYRYQNAKDKIEEHINNGNKGTATFITTAVVSQSENVSEEFTKRTLNYATLTMEAIKRDLDENGEMKLDSESRKQRRLVTTKVLDRLLQNLEEQNITLDEESKQKIDRYREFYKDYMEQVKEQNRQKANNKKSTLTLGEVQNKTKEGAIPDELTPEQVQEKEVQEIQK